jgi:PPK2 family polyphosphate:nucleotide phosphotransferase
MAMRLEVLNQLRIDPREKFRLADHDPGWLPPDVRRMPKKKRKAAGEKMLAENKAELAEAQALLYADNRYSMLIVLQAMDAAGKDGTIKHVMSGVNPQGCSVTSFKAPSAEELDHDFLWRCTKALPARGDIGIFNRSYYEEVLVTRVHPAILDNQRLPVTSRGHAFWDARYDDINNFERHLVRNGTVILKFFLNVSKAEQKRRFMERLDTPEKNWKFSAADIRERQRWNDYQHAYEDAINATSTSWAPWYVIPADRKWAMRAAVSDVITTTITSLDLSYPQLSDEDRAELAKARQELEAEGG